MTTAAELIKYLQQFPADATIHVSVGQDIDWSHITKWAPLHLVEHTGTDAVRDDEVKSIYLGEV